MSVSRTFVVNEDANKKLVFLHNENDIDIFLEKTTGKEIYAGRARGA